MNTSTNDTTINFSDIFKSSFLDKMSSFTITDLLIALFISIAIGLFIYLIYKKRLMVSCTLKVFR